VYIGSVKNIPGVLCLGAVYDTHAVAYIVAVYDHWCSVCMSAICIEPLVSYMLMLCI
jgi:hypothetical protein